MSDLNSPSTVVSQVVAVADSSVSTGDLDHGSMVAGWLNTKLERDKSILTLSAGGIGLLATLLTTVGPGTPLVLAGYIVAMAAFSIARATVINVFDRNAKHLEQVMRRELERDPKLARLDALSYWSFIAGAAFLAVIGVSAGIDKLVSQTGGEVNKSGSSSRVTTESVVTGKHSYDGISNMRPPAAPTVPPAAPAVAPLPSAPATSQSTQDAGSSAK